MAYGGYSYIDFKYKPHRDDFVVLFWVKGTLPIEKLAEGIAAESSVGSWTKLATMNEFVWKHYRARVFRIEKVGAKAGLVWIAYPLEHFDVKNLMQFEASVLGNIFGLKELEELYVHDISIPKKYQKQFKGPALGTEGIRKLAGTEKSRRPHIGTIVKPKVGLAPAEWAHVAYEAFMGGLDLVKDDENLVDQKFCRWDERLHETMKVIEKAEKETGEPHLYSCNVTDRYSRMVERIEKLHDMGVEKNVLVMLDVHLLGPSSLLDVLELTRKYKFATHGHRAGFAALNRGTYGVNFQIYEKLYRLMGIDQMHIGTGVGKMEGSPVMIKRLHDISQERSLVEKLYLGSLGFEYDSDIKPMLSIASGGLDAGRIEALVALHGNDTNFQAGAGVHGHPGGTRAGAASMRQAVEAVMDGVPLPEAAGRHQELAEALEFFGYVKPDGVLNELAYERKNAKMLTKLALRKGRPGMVLANE